MHLPSDRRGKRVDNRRLAQRTGAVVAAVLIACLAAGPSNAADKPLSQDDVVLLLLGGATTEKMVALIEQRGVDFRMNPDLAKKFFDAGADDIVIEALQKAGAKVTATPPAAAAPPPPAATSPSAESSTQPVSAPEPAPKKSGLREPTPDEIQRIIQEFAAKEKVFKEARNNYTYHQINKVDDLDADGNVRGSFLQEWDILYDDSGRRIERVTHAPPDTLKGVQITKEDLDSMRNIQPFVLTSDELLEYDVKYLGHVKVDEITAYVFSIRPKEIKKGRLYFQGTVWVDDRDLQIVKSEGKSVPEVKKGKENLFPRFITYREQIDGKYWFPTFTIADDKLYFSSGAVRIKQVIRYTEYKQFKSRVRIISSTPTDTPETQPATPTTPEK